VRTEDEPKLQAHQAFKLSDEQAEEILETKLRRLAKLEEMKSRRAEKARRRTRRRSKRFKKQSPAHQLVREETLSDAEEYGDERRTRWWSAKAAQAISETELLTSEPTTVVLSRLGGCAQQRP